MNDTTIIALAPIYGAAVVVLYYAVIRLISSAQELQGYQNLAKIGGNGPTTPPASK